MGSFLAGRPNGRCLLKLMLTVNLVSEGMVTFRYQYKRSEALFMFDVQNDRCESLGDAGPGPWMEETEQGEIASRTISSPDSQSNADSNYPALLHSIEVTGLPFVYSCQPCHAGSHTSAPGQARCTACPRDQFSPGGGVSCQACPGDQYAPPGSSECQPRPECRLYEAWQARRATVPMARPGCSTGVQRVAAGSQAARSAGPEEPCSRNPCHPERPLVESPAPIALPRLSTRPVFGRLVRTMSAMSGQHAARESNCWLITGCLYLWMTRRTSLPSATGDFLSVSCHSTDSELGCPGGSGWLATRSYISTAAARGFSSRAFKSNWRGASWLQTSDLFWQSGPANAGRLTIEFAVDCNMPCQLLCTRILHNEARVCVGNGATVSQDRNFDENATERSSKRFSTVSVTNANRAAGASECPLAAPMRH
uniref:Ephrin_rec_like domain-containing protein n=1 Tax=Macrostomum lignano TaxID=282301 RepID=A0A1I8FQ40_9PLAT